VRYEFAGRGRSGLREKLGAGSKEGKASLFDPAPAKEIN